MFGDEILKLKFLGKKLFPLIFHYRQLFSSHFMMFHTHRAGKLLLAHPLVPKQFVKIRAGDLLGKHGKRVLIQDL